MKGSKDFEMNRFVDDGLQANYEAAISDDAPQSEQSDRNVQTRRQGRTQFADKTTSAVSSEPATQILTAGKTEQAVPGEQTMQTRLSVPAQSVESIQHTEQTQSTQPTPQRISSRQRKASLDEYREAFLQAPKISDRQPVFVSRETRDRIDSIVRRLGDRKMSVSGFLENLAHYHLELYADDLEQWKRL